jgi:hypothetical protein
VARGDNFYGFPVYGEVATKLGQHMGGHEVTAETRTFEPDPVRVRRYRDFLGRYIPGFLGPELYTKTCLYTIPPDQNFVVDTLAEHPQISVAIGAGHAYKFAGLIGRILSELALEGSPPTPSTLSGWTARRSLTKPSRRPSTRDGESTMTDLTDLLRDREPGKTLPREFYWTRICSRRISRGSSTPTGSSPATRARYRSPATFSCSPWARRS